MRKKNIVSIKNKRGIRRERNRTEIIKVNDKEKRPKNRSLRNTRNNRGFRRKVFLNTDLLRTVCKITSEPVNKERGKVKKGQSINERSMGDRVKGFRNIKENRADGLTFVKRREPGVKSS